MMCNEHLYHIHADDSKQYTWDIETAINSLILSKKDSIFKVSGIFNQNSFGTERLTLQKDKINQWVVC